MRNRAREGVCSNLSVMLSPFLVAIRPRRYGKRDACFVPFCMWCSLAVEFIAYVGQSRDRLVAARNLLRASCLAVGTCASVMHKARAGVCLGQLDNTRDCISNSTKRNDHKSWPLMEEPFNSHYSIVLLFKDILIYCSALNVLDNFPLKSIPS
ncbi:hypothetical protein GGQ71_004549 [Rhizobium taibaishanense]|uniref:Uncharacterized protein n=1 Tax=Allorhizobium taibaishanense TaxID=887144 RepID=A0A7W6HRU3_9HYPH|nr:hypothetical protein [Allorhizobium taibaishanense]